MIQEKRAAGFTLIELMIVVVVIGIIAAIAVPNYVGAKATANESVVVGSLRSLTTAQFKFKSMNLVDVDGNGVSEFGWIGEMVGKAPLRGTSEAIDPNLLSLSFGQVDVGGRVLRGGYFFRVHLADAAGVGLTETTLNFSNPDPLMGEAYWTAVAWPVRKGTSGKAAFFVNQRGEMIKSLQAPYSGTGNEPPAGCGLLGVPANRIDSNEIAIGQNGADGNLWVLVKN